jgi:PAS domain S-box-containing protein
MIVELDKTGRIIDISPSLSIIYGGTIEKMKGKYYEAYVAQDNESQQKFKEFWENLIKNGKGKRKQKLTYHNKDIWLLESYLLIQKEGLAPKIMMVAVDKTKEKELTDKFNAELKAKNIG